MQSFKVKPNSATKKAGFYKNKSYNINKYWKQGQPVTEADLVLLASVVKFYEEKGYTPTKDDIDNVAQLKARFRTWNNVLLAAGLPERNDPENQRKRMEALKHTKQKDE